MFLVMPFADFEDLFEVLRKRAVPFIESEARWLFRQLLSGADYLHRRGIGFRDHSLENVLLFLDKETGLIVPRITDPGQAVRFQPDESDCVRELNTGEQRYTNACDHVCYRYLRMIYVDPFPPRETLAYPERSCRAICVSQGLDGFHIGASCRKTFRKIVPPTRSVP